MEPPGTAPGSEPIITGAFITIVRVAPNTVNIGPQAVARKVVGYADDKDAAAVSARASRGRRASMSGGAR